MVHHSYHASQVASKIVISFKYRNQEKVPYILLEGSAKLKTSLL
jgi:hypothetical protein